MKRIIRVHGPGPLLALISLSLLGAAAVPVEALEGALPAPLGELLAAAPLDPDVPSPEEVLGFSLGSRHILYGELARYFEVLAESSDRVILEEQGRTHGGRPILLATISSPGNLARLEEIRRQQLEALDPARPAPSAGELERRPVIVWLAYSIHGNEASGSNAAPRVAHLLAAAQGGVVDELLESAVVLIDPSQNPDGLDRFAQWANMHQGVRPVGGGFHRERREAWPGGRGNHYWFDLNRDWLLLQHPESRARVAIFQRWRPQVVGDFHEMGSESTYFFQPGVSTRVHPLIPQRNQELTLELARFHARALDRAGTLYYTGETFDDFYVGKGSTYPDVQGSVGILFEQASARGLLRETALGTLDFGQAIANQVATSFSTLEGSVARRAELLAFQAAFAREAWRRAAASPVAGWACGLQGDGARVEEFRGLLTAHGIETGETARAFEVGGGRVEAGDGFFVPHRQRQSLLLESAFERRTEFPDEVFYDVSTWNLPLAFGVPCAELRTRELERLGTPDGEAGAGEPVWAAPQPQRLTERPLAYAVGWQGLYAPRALYRLLEGGAVVRAASSPFTASTPAGQRSFERGTLVVLPDAEGAARAELEALLERVAVEDGVQVAPLATGLAVEGVDLGSPGVRPLERPRIALAVGRGVRVTEAGELWHLFDHRWEIPVTLLELELIGEGSLSEHSHLLLVDGSQQNLAPEAQEAVEAWVRRGGVLVASKGAAAWAAERLLGREATMTGAEQSETEENDEAPARTVTAAPSAVARGVFAEAARERARERIAGAIFEVELDLTHPLAWGFRNPSVAVVRDSVRVLPGAPEGHQNAGVYSTAPLLSGFASEENVERLAGSAAMVATPLGRGVVVQLADNLAFRGIWQGTTRALANSVFFAHLMR
jgi:hypothetical protein